MTSGPKDRASVKATAILQIVAQHIQRDPELRAALEAYLRDDDDALKRQVANDIRREDE